MSQIRFWLTMVAALTLGGAALIPLSAQPPQTGDGPRGDEKGRRPQLRTEELHRPSEGAPERGRFSDADSVRQRFDQLMNERMKTMDRDGDGKVTLQEYLATQEEAFKRIDRDGNGELSVDEMRQPAAASLWMTGGALPAESQDPGARARMFVSRADRDRDGFISAEEFGRSEEDFKKADTNADNKLDPAEVEAMFRKAPGMAPGPGGPLMPPGAAGDPAAQRFQGLLRARDRNGDGKLSPEEFGGAPELFKDADKDGDGLLSAEELGEYLKNNPRAAGMWMGRGPEDRPGADMRRGGEVGPAPEELAAKLLEKKDTDGDGRLSKSEMQEYQNVFDKYDANADGFLTAEELKDFKGGPMMIGPEGDRRGPADGPGRPTRDRRDGR